jgi:hypothetical protein
MFLRNVGLYPNYSAIEARKLYYSNNNSNSLQFQGSGHGNLRACVSRDQGSTGTDCNEVKNLEEMALKISSPCANYAYQCPPVYLTITVTNTLTRCTGRLQFNK